MFYDRSNFVAYNACFKLSKSNFKILSIMIVLTLVPIYICYKNIDEEKERKVRERLFIICVSITNAPYLQGCIRG